jgi:hypothetical protein
MARKKKSAVVAMQMPSSGGEVNTGISTAENGFIVNVSGDTGGKTPGYFSKRFIATSRPQALRIANHHMKGKAGKKKLSLKKSAA